MNICENGRRRGQVEKGEDGKDEKEKAAEDGTDAVNLMSVLCKVHLLKPFLFLSLFYSF